MNIVRCDNCGKDGVDARRFAGDARTAAWEANADFVHISAEHDEDVQCFDACSWACAAELAMKRAAESMTRLPEVAP